MTDLEELMRAGDPASRLTPTPDAGKADRIAAILASDQDQRRFEGVPGKGRPRWLHGLGLVIAVLLIVAAAIPGRGNQLMYLSKGPDDWADQILLKAAEAQTDPPAVPGQYWAVERQGRSAIPDMRSHDDPATPDTDQLAYYVVAEHTIKYLPAAEPDHFCTWLVHSEQREKVGPVADLSIGGTGAYCGPSLTSGYDPYRIDLREVPHDQDGLRRYLRAKHLDEPADSWGFVLNQVLVNFQYPSADLRAAMLRHAIDIPGVQVIDPHVRIAGRSAVAIGMPDPAGVDVKAYQGLLVDPRTGELLGFGGAIEPGRVDYVLSHSVTLIDGLPADLEAAVCESAARDGQEMGVEIPTDPVVCPSQ